MLSTGIQAKAFECRRLAKNYEINLVASPLSPILNTSLKYTITNITKDTKNNFSASLENAEKKEVLNSTLLVHCNEFSFLLPFNFIDTKGITGVKDATYLLNYNCTAKIKSKKGLLKGICIFKDSNLGEIQITDKLDLLGKSF